MTGQFPVPCRRAIAAANARTALTESPGLIHVPPGRAGRAPHPSRHTRPADVATASGATTCTCSGGRLGTALGSGADAGPELGAGAAAVRVAHAPAATAAPVTPANCSSRRRLNSSPGPAGEDAPMSVTIRNPGHPPRGVSSSATVDLVTVSGSRVARVYAVGTVLLTLAAAPSCGPAARPPLDATTPARSSFTGLSAHASSPANRDWMGRPRPLSR